MYYLINIEFRDEGVLKLIFELSNLVDEDELDSSLDKWIEALAFMMSFNKTI